MLTETSKNYSIFFFASKTILLRNRKYYSLLPAPNVLEQVIIDKLLPYEHLQLAGGAVHGLPRHGTQGTRIAGSTLVLDDIVAARHVEVLPRGRKPLGRVEPRAAHESGAHQDLDGAEPGEDRRDGVEGQLRPVPGRRRLRRLGVSPGLHCPWQTPE